MNSQLLLLINFFIVTALVMYFLTARSKRKQGPTLDLQQSDPEWSKVKKEQVSAVLATEEKTASIPTIAELPTVKKIGLDKVEIQEPAKNKKEIVYFVYNGHEWEAHEILGLESGVTLAEATQHYQELIKSSDPSTFEFYDAAFAAILKLKRNQW